jgi:hypothetical protein
MHGIEFRAGQVVNCVLALVDNAEDVVNATLRAIVYLKSASSSEAAVKDRKDERVKNRLK